MSEATDKVSATAGYVSPLDGAFMPLPEPAVAYDLSIASLANYCSVDR